MTREAKVGGTAGATVPMPAAARRQRFWAALDQVGRDELASRASELRQGQRYYLLNGGRAVRLDDSSVHIENRQLGRMATSGICAMHELTPSRPAPKGSSHPSPLSDREAIVNIVWKVR